MVAQDRKETESNDRSIRRGNLVIFVLIAFLIVLIVTIWYSQSMLLHQPVKDSKYTQYVNKVKQRYKTHLPNVSQSYWLPTNMDTFIQLSLTSRDKPRDPRVDEDSANQRIVSERSMTFDHLLSEIDASPGFRILVVGQPGIGKTTLLQMITRYWAQDRALSSCWILLHTVLRDLVLLQHAPNLTTFLSFMKTMNLPPDIETFVLESDGKGLCFIADGLDEYPAGYENETNFIFSELTGARKPNIKLPQSTVVISSRPEVSSQVWDMFDKHVEVLGFGDDQINEYIQAKYGEDKSFSKYLDDHPHIKHACFIPLHLAMLVYLKDSLLDSLPETETEMYEQFIIHTLNRDFCKNPTSSCSRKNTLPTSLNNVDESSEIGTLLFHIANLSYVGIQKEQSIFTEVEPVLQYTNSSLLVVDKMSVLQPTTYSFPHLTIQEFLAAFYFNTYLSQQEQKKVLVEYSFRQIKFDADSVFLKFCCHLKRNENQTTFLEFFNLLYQHNNRSMLPYHCAHEAQSIIASQQLISFTGGIAKLSDFSYYVGLSTYYDAASFAFVAVSAAQNLRVIDIFFVEMFPRFLLDKLCGIKTNYSRLRNVKLRWIDPSNIGCLLEKSPDLESLSVTGVRRNWDKSLSEDAAALVLPPYGTEFLNIRFIRLHFLNIVSGVWDWNKLQSEDAAALVLPPYGTKLLNIRNIHLDNLNIGDKGVEKLYQLLQNSTSLETLSLRWNGISDNGASTIADLMKDLPLLQHVYLGRNHIGGRGAALLWNQSIHKCCNLDLDYNGIGGDRPDAFISALRSSVNEYGFCQLQVTVFGNKFLCSDLGDILEISEHLPKGVVLTTEDYCFEMIQKIFKRLKYYLNHPPTMAGLQWMCYVICTFYIFYSTRTPLWGLF